MPILHATTLQWLSKNIQLRKCGRPRGNKSTLFMCLVLRWDGHSVWDSLYCIADSHCRICGAAPHATFGTSADDELSDHKAVVKSKNNRRATAPQTAQTDQCENRDLLHKQQGLYSGQPASPKTTVLETICIAWFREARVCRINLSHPHTLRGPLQIPKPLGQVVGRSAQKLANLPRPSLNGQPDPKQKNLAKLRQHLHRKPQSHHVGFVHEGEKGGSSNSDIPQQRLNRSEDDGRVKTSCSLRTQKRDRAG